MKVAGFTIALSIQAALPPGTVEIYEGVEGQPVVPGTSSGIQVSERKEADRFVIVKVANRSGRERSLGIRLVTSLSLKGACSFWDGFQEHSTVRGLTVHDKLVDSVPIACAWDGAKGVALGFDPSTFYSYMKTTCDGKRLTYETRAVLRDGTEAEIRFVAFDFAPDWGWRSALDRYYLMFPECFHPHPKVDPRVTTRLEGLPFNYRNRFSPAVYAEMHRRLRAGRGWDYAPFMVAGDFYGRQEVWDMETRESVIKQRLAARGKTLDEWLKCRQKSFETGKEVNVAEMFYLSNFADPRLTEREFAEAVIQPPTAFEVMPELLIVGPRVFCAGGPFGRRFNEDVTKLCKELYLAGFAWDSSGGMGSRIYRGPMIWEMPVAAFDEQGPFVLEGVGIAKAIHHMHTVPTFGGRHVAACHINPGGEHPMPYMLNVAGDIGMLEWQEALPYGRDIPLIEKYRRLMGQKALGHYPSLRGDRLGEIVEWHQYPPEQIKLLYRAVWEYHVLGYLYNGILPRSGNLLGVPQMFPIADMLIDLVAQRGWYASPGATAPDGVMLSRYGQGFRGAVCFGNPETRIIEGQARIVGKDFVPKGCPLAVAYMGEEMAFELDKGDARFKLLLKPRHWRVIDLVGAWDGKGAAKLTTKIEKTRHVTMVILTNTGRPIQGRWQFPIRDNCETPTVTFAGRQLEGHAEGNVLTVEGELPAKGAMEVQYRSKCYRSPDDRIAAFEFCKGDKPNCEIILPESKGEYAKYAAKQIQAYFEFWYQVASPARKQVLLPIHEKGQPASLPCQVTLEVGQPRSVQVDGAVLRITATDDWDLQQWVWEALGVLDVKYPYHDVFHGIGATQWVPDPPYECNPKTKQMLKEAGLVGKLLCLYEGPELKDMPKRSPEELKKFYETKDPNTQATRSKPLFAEPFDSTEGWSAEKGYRCEEIQVELEMHQKKEGGGCIRMKWKAAEDGSGTAQVSKSIHPIDITGRSFHLWFMPQMNTMTGFGVEFTDENGQLVERHRVFHGQPNEWNELVFKQGEKAKWEWMDKHEGDPKRVTKMVVRAHTQEAGQSGEVFWDDFRIE